jgi:hypothetical protein
MEACGDHVMVVTYNPVNGSCQRYGSATGLAFLRARTDLEAHFINFVSGKNATFTSVVVIFIDVCLPAGIKYFKK